MVNNIDRTDAPNINSVIPSRNWEVVQGDNRPVLGLRFRNPDWTEADPVYDDIYASDFIGHILQRRSAAGTDPLSVDLDFSQASFSYNTSTGIATSTNEVQVHVPWLSPNLVNLNPEPNRGVAFLYDIWTGTYPNAEANYITFPEGNRLYFTFDRSRTAAIGQITRESDTTIEVTAPQAGTLYNWNLGDLVYMTFFFDGGSNEQQFILGEVTGTSTSAGGIQSFELGVISFQPFNGIDMRNDPAVNIPDPYGGTLESGSTVLGMNPDFAIEISRHYLRGVGLIRERISANPSAGNEGTPTDGSGS